MFQHTSCMYTSLFRFDQFDKWRITWWNPVVICSNKTTPKIEIIKNIAVISFGKDRSTFHTAHGQYKATENKNVQIKSPASMLNTWVPQLIFFTIQFTIAVDNEHLIINDFDLFIPSSEWETISLIYRRFEVLKSVFALYPVSYEGWFAKLKIQISASRSLATSVPANWEILELFLKKKESERNKFIENSIFQIVLFVRTFSNVCASFIAL